MRAGIAITAATVGALIGLAAKEISHRALCALVSFAAGALLAVTILQIIPEAVEMAGWGSTLASVAVAVVFFYLIGKYVSYICPACAASVADQQGAYLRLGILLMVALGLHSTVDGLAIAVGAEAAPVLGVLVLFAVSYHKVPEGLALASVARLAGMSRVRSLLITILIQLTTGLGAFIGLFIATRGLSEHWLGLILGHAGGSFLYVVGFALFMEIREHEKAPIITYLALGFLAIAVTGYGIEQFGAISHGHGH